VTLYLPGCLNFTFQEADWTKRLRRGMGGAVWLG
jgi:hypothetical protein